MGQFNHLFSFLWSFLVAVFAIPSIVHLAKEKKLFDLPNHRTMHSTLIPRLGGIAIFSGFMSALTIFGNLNPVTGIQYLLAGCIIIFLLGLKDDIKPVSAFKKFFVQIIATGIVMFLGDIRITSFQGIMGIYELTYGSSYIFTFFLIIGITNAINLIDGLDGLAGSVILIIASAFGFYLFQAGSPYAIVAFCLAGSIIGFLRYNLNKAIIFMGDTGALVSGFIIAILAIKFIELKPIPIASPAVAVSILIIPILDTLRVFFIRIINGKSPFVADKNHLHHRLIALGFSALQSVIILAILNILCVAIIVNLSYLGNFTILVILFSFAVIFSLALEVDRFFIQKQPDEKKISL